MLHLSVIRHGFVPLFHFLKRVTSINMKSLVRSERRRVGVVRSVSCGVESTVKDESLGIPLNIFIV